MDANLRLYVVSKRISHYSVVIGGMLLFWLWEAQLINYFTFPLNKLPFNSLEEFLYLRSFSLDASTSRLTSCVWLKYSLFDASEQIEIPYAPQILLIQWRIKQEHLKILLCVLKSSFQMIFLWYLIIDSNYIS